MLNRRIVLMAAAGLVLNSTQPGFAITIPDVDIPILKSGTPTHTIRMQALTTADGHAYDVFSAVPVKPAPDRGYPILYMLDGNAAFDALTPELLSKVPELVIVAVGYPGARAFDVVARSLDYTPPPLGQTGPMPDPGRPERQIGGAGAFLERLRGEIRSFAEEGITIDPERRALWGHSYGGLFTVFTFFTAPDAFNTYVPVSASLSFGDKAVLALEPDATAPLDRKRLLVMMGDMESRSGQPKLTEPRPNPETLALIERLKAHPELSVSSIVLEGAQHGPALRLSIPYALEFAAQ